MFIFIPAYTILSGGAHVHNAAMSFRVHHYIGSYEMFRLRGARGIRSEFESRNSQGIAVFDDTIRQYSSPANKTWLSQFVNIVGREKALDLTERIRIREEWEAERNLFRKNQQSQG